MKSHKAEKLYCPFFSSACSFVPQTFFYYYHKYSDTPLISKPVDASKKKKANSIMVGFFKKVYLKQVNLRWCPTSNAHLPTCPPAQPPDTHLDITILKDGILKNISKKLEELHCFDCSDSSFNPFMPSGFFYHNSLDQSISNCRLVFIIFMFYRNPCI